MIAGSDFPLYNKNCSTSIGSRYNTPNLTLPLEHLSLNSDKVLKRDKRYLILGGGSSVKVRNHYYYNDI